MDPVMDSPRSCHDFAVVSNHIQLCTTPIYVTSGLGLCWVIKTIRWRGTVYSLRLSHGQLGDTKCIQLFQFLKSPARCSCRESLTELALARNLIGSGGLLGLVGFLRDNTVLRALDLSDNPLTSDPTVIAEFVMAVNSSRLSALYMACNHSLSDLFAQAYLPKLDAPYLRELDVSWINMSRVSVPNIIDYVKSPRCRLRRLGMRGNRLKMQEGLSIINAIEESNYSLYVLDFAMRYIPPVDWDGEATMVQEEFWRVVEHVALRNFGYTKEVEEQALLLLRYCRTIYLLSGQPKYLSAFPLSASTSSGSRSSALFKPSLFLDLPTELQLNILAFLAPALSRRQCLRVLLYAATSATLPQTSQLPKYRRSLKDRLTSIINGKPPHCGLWRPPEWFVCRCSSSDLRTCWCWRIWKRERRDIWSAQVSCDTKDFAYG